MKIDLSPNEEHSRQSRNERKLIERDIKPHPNHSYKGGEFSSQLLCTHYKHKIDIEDQLKAKRLEARPIASK